MSKVFISYSQFDKQYAYKLREIFISNNIEVDMYDFWLHYGQNIEKQINKKIKESDRTILLASENSLQSPWVAEEVLLTINYSSIYGKNKLIVSYLNDITLDSVLVNKIYKTIEDQINEVSSEIIDRMGQHYMIRDLEPKLTRLYNFKNNFDEIIRHVKEFRSINLKGHDFLSKFEFLLKELREEESEKDQINEIQKKILSFIFYNQIGKLCDILPTIITKHNFKSELLEYVYKNSCKYRELVQKEQRGEIDNMKSKLEKEKIKNVIYDIVLDTKRKQDLIQLNPLFDNKNKLLERITNKLKFIEKYVKKWQNKFDSRISIIIFDIDNYTVMNKKYGSEVGDLIKSHFSQITNSYIKNIENSLKYINQNKRFICDWLGQDEFFILISGFGDKKSNNIAKNINQEIKNYKWDSIEEELFVTACAGVAEYDFKNYSEPVEKWIIRAMIGMKEAKKKGRGVIKNGPKPESVLIKQEDENSNMSKKKDNYSYSGNYPKRKLGRIQEKIQRTREQQRNQLIKKGAKKVPKYVLEYERKRLSEYFY
jgi:diguanylate cyclase (GGDEF)-like protein